MKKLLVSTLLVCSVFFLNAQTHDVKKTAFQSNSALRNKNITAMIIPGINGTWGYSISIGNKLMISQPNIPGIQGNEGFKTKKDARKVANLAISKMKKGQLPPSISIEELRKLKTL